MRAFFPLTMSAAILWLTLTGCTGEQSSLSAASTGTGGLPGTSSGAAGAGGRDVGALIDELCNLTGPLLCDAFFTCCNHPEQLGLGVDLDGCKAKAAGDYCTWRGMPKQGLASGDITFDQAKMDACVAELKSMLAGGPACGNALVVYDTVCAGAFQGKRLPGEDCTLPDDDLESFWQCHEGRCMQGKCSPFLKPGDPCTVTSSTLGTLTPGTLCNYVNQEWCFGPTYMGPGVCGPEREVGDACDPTSPDPSHECKSFACDSMLGQCVEGNYVSLCTRY